LPEAIMKHNRLVAAAALFLASAVLMCYLTRPTVSARHYGRISVGMAEGEVRRLAGEPRTRYDPRPSRCVRLLEEGEVSTPEWRFDDIRDGKILVACRSRSLSLRICGGPLTLLESPSGTTT
jgi:hypothetical protein